VESARGAVLKRDSYFAAQYRRLAKRRGDKKAIVAVAHSILVIAYHVLRDGQSYHELGGTYFDRVNTDRFTRYNTERLAALGYAVRSRRSRPGFRRRPGSRGRRPRECAAPCPEASRRRCTPA